MKPKIFISHSAKSTDVQGFLSAIHQELLGAEFDVRLDIDGLDLGDGWRHKLFQWMDEVHGAVLLLSHSALESKFVPIELSILSFRHLREQNFPLLPVLVGNVQPEELDQGTIGDLRLREIQCLVATDPQETARQLVAHLQRQCNRVGRLRTPMEVLEDDVVKLLSRAGFERLEIEEAAWQICDQGWTASSSEQQIFRSFARELFRMDYEQACDALLALGKGTTAHDAKRCLLEILDLITPFWVLESAASKLAQLAMGQYSERTFTLCCAEPWTAHSYVSRSSMKPLGAGWHVCELMPPESEDPLEWIMNQLAASLTPAAGPARQTQTRDVKRRLERKDSRREPVFLLFPPNWVLSPNLLRRLQEELPTLTILVTGPERQLEILHPLAHQLDFPGEDRELAACDAYDDTKDDLARVLV
ncbi:toll/interleukin-1 receptor domain-containing protein [Stieleria varia]|uniref:TIR domain-containing protein n=1 Tax=Stieleria varia TaxID=2528005 RepID=A0A5C6B3K4_9BACT|nr:toll/interleukin-1 receptor domain-containing protein [Stieleria varia]TWU06480.1 hypothetical protein Pla52n_22010 [Stieleria varia]